MHTSGTTPPDPDASRSKWVEWESRSGFRVLSIVRKRIAIELSLSIYTHVFVSFSIIVRTKVSDIPSRPTCFSPIMKIMIRQSDVTVPGISSKDTMVRVEEPSEIFDHNINNTNMFLHNTSVLLFSLYFTLTYSYCALSKSVEMRLTLAFRHRTI